MASTLKPYPGHLPSMIELRQPLLRLMRSTVNPASLAKAAEKKLRVTHPYEGSKLQWYDRVWHVVDRLKKQGRVRKVSRGHYVAL